MMLKHHSVEPASNARYAFPLTALYKKSATATQLDLKSAIANRQVRHKDVQYIGECESAMFGNQQVTFCAKPPLTIK